MIITLSGAIGSGKDTFSGLLEDNLVAKSAQVKFADPLREVAFGLGFNPDNRATKEIPMVMHFGFQKLHEEIFQAFRYFAPTERNNLAVVVWDEVVNKRIGWFDEQGNKVPRLSCREMMIAVGMHARAMREDYFIHHLLQTIESNDAVDHFIVSDCRFPNELVGGMHIHIERPGNPFDKGSTSVTESHGGTLRERADHIVVNDGSLQDLDETAYIISLLIGE